MIRLTVKELFARKLRLLSTAFAVVIGVAFMAGTFIFTDTLRATYDSAVVDTNEGVDSIVRAPSAIDVGYGEPTPRIDASVADQVRQAPGVADVAVRVEGFAQLIDRDGEAVGDLDEVSALGLNWIAADELNPYRIVEGHAPASDDEIVIDRASAREADYAPGDIATVLTQQAPRQFTIAGIASFGSEDAAAGATAVLFTDTMAQALLATPGQVDGILARAVPGVSQGELARSIEAVVAGDVEVLTGAQLVDEAQESVADEFSSFRVFLMIFALVAVFVGAFIINNTFSITVAQRSKEMAMLRAVGAGRRQVLRMVLAEAVAVGTAASAAGLAAGLAIARGLKVLLTSFGIELPDGPLVVHGNGLAVSFAVGLAITVLSAWLPARRAGRIAPIAALRDVAVDRSGGSRRRAVIGTGVTAAGVAALLAGLGGGAMPLVGLGAVGVFVGVAVLGPVIARPVARLLGAPLRLIGVSGDLAVRNAVRNPKRTARTASSLMIGVALVGFFAVFAASAKTSIAGSLRETFHGTATVESGAFDATAGLSPDLAETLRHTDGVRTVSAARTSPATIGDSGTTDLQAFDGATIGQLWDLGTVQGSFASLGADGIAVHDEHAVDEGWTIGSPVTVTFPSGPATFTVRAIFDDGSEWVGDEFVDVAAFATHVPDQFDTRVFVDGDLETVRSIAAAYPSAEVLDEDGFIEQVNGEIDQTLAMVTAMLALAIVIALLGITNTMALSVFERTRELGLLRAVGMSRSQVRAVIRGESMIIAVLGTVLGLGIGTFFGWAMVRALADQGIDTLTIPVTQLVVVTVAAGCAGALAAILPARRTARMDVLSALATA
jgi:putative ABC transport system permease protein